MYLYLLIVAAILMVAGLVLAFFSLREKKVEAPRFPTSNPRLWFTPIWKQKDWFTPSGFRKYALRCSLMGSGAFLGLVTRLLH
jgi:hypothetical protein